MATILSIIVTKEKKEKHDRFAQYGIDKAEIFQLS